jgi:hypothetical protein
MILSKQPVIVPVMSAIIRLLAVMSATTSENTSTLNKLILEIKSLF